jgi:hypothetical protein
LTSILGSRLNPKHFVSDPAAQPTQPAQPAQPDAKAPDDPITRARRIARDKAFASINAKLDLPINSWVAILENERNRPLHLLLVSPHMFRDSMMQSRYSASVRQLSVAEIQALPKVGIHVDKLPVVSATDPLCVKHNVLLPNTRSATRNDAVVVFVQTCIDTGSYFRVKDIESSNTLSGKVPAPSITPEFQKHWNQSTMNLSADELHKF